MSLSQKVTYNENLINNINLNYNFNQLKHIESSITENL